MSHGVAAECGKWGPRSPGIWPSCGELMGVNNPPPTNPLNKWGNKLCRQWRYHSCVHAGGLCSYLCFENISVCRDDNDDDNHPLLRDDNQQDPIGTGCADANPLIAGIQNIILGHQLGTSAVSTEIDEEEAEKKSKEKLELDRKKQLATQYVSKVATEAQCQVQMKHAQPQHHVVQQPYLQQPIIVQPPSAPVQLVGMGNVPSQPHLVAMPPRPHQGGQSQQNLAMFERSRPPMFGIL